MPGRLVGEDEGGFVDQCARHGHELLLAARELPGKEVLLRDDREAVERVGDERVALALLDVAVRQRHIEVLGHGEVVEQVILLEHEPDVLLVERHAVLGLHLVHHVVEEAVLARPVAVEHAEHREQRGLPRPGWTHDRDELAGGDVDGDLPQQEQAAVPLGDGLVEVLELDHSDLRATIGSTRAARRAGRQLATSETIASNATTPTNVVGSLARTPYRSAVSSRVTARAIKTPTPIPAAARRTPSPTTCDITSPRLAPSASRMPSSRRRCPTAYARSP